MKKHKKKIIAAVIVVAVLVGAWAFGGDYANKGGDSGVAIAVDNATPTAPIVTESEATSATPDAEEPTLPPTDAADEAPIVTATFDDAEAPTATAEAELLSTEVQEAAVPTEEPAPTMEINPETGRDAYNTDPVPEGKPLPVEPQNVVNGDGSFTVTLSVRCDTILNNMRSLDPEKVELVPEDGIIFPETTVTVHEGESVFNVLLREMKRAKIHMEFVNVPIYNSAYIEGIHNLYEFDCGELSGWMYSVNGWFPNYGCSRYQLQPGDVIEWQYTCDLGRDVGGFYAIG